MIYMLPEQEFYALQQKMKLPHRFHISIQELQAYRLQLLCQYLFFFLLLPLFLCLSRGFSQRASVHQFQDLHLILQE